MSNFSKGLSFGFLSTLNVAIIFLQGEEFEYWFHKGLLLSLVSIGFAILSTSE